MTNERSNPGPDIDQVPTGPMPTPAADRYSEIRSDPASVYHPDAVRNPHAHPGVKGDNH